MYLYLKFGTSVSDVKVVSNVTIGDDCCPVVNGQAIYGSATAGDTSTASGSGGGSIDAICWFKALPMQAVYIDCSSKEARWCPKSVTFRDSDTVQLRRSGVSCQETSTVSPADHQTDPGGDPVPFMPESTRQLFSEQPGMAGFNPVIDEMFERVEKLCSQWEALEDRGLTNREVARILHCYVFPAVRFEKEDAPVLQQCLRLIVVKHETVSQEIMVKEKHIDVTDKYLDRLKEVILTQNRMSSQLYLQACNADFVEVFYLQTMKDIQNKNIKLDILQAKINEMKKKSQAAERLDRLKAERDALHSSVQKLLMVREAIRNHLYRPFVPKKKNRKHKVKIDEKDASLHTNFQTVHDQLVADKDHLKQLCYRKLHLTSVREAIESTVKMLQREHPVSFGDFTEFSVSPDCGEEGKTSWKSMQARVDGWMERDSALRRRHLAGCQLIQDLREGMLGDAQVSLMGLHSLHTPHKGGQMPGSNGRGGVRDVSSERAPMVQTLRNQALVHMWDVAESIVLRLKLDASPESRHLNRAWMCYDPHFWKEAGEAIERVYSHYHAATAHEIRRRVSSAALADLLDSRFFQKVFVDGVSAEAEQPEKTAPEKTAFGRWASQESASALSLDLQRCSVTDLYALANRDGARVNCHMLDMEDLIASSPLEPPCFSSCSDLSEADQGRGGKEDISRDNDSGGSETSGQSGVTGTADSDETGKHGHSHSFSSSQSADDFEVISSPDDSASDQSRREASLRSSQTITSILGVFEAVVEPYHEKVRQVLKAPSLMQKMRGVWQSVDFLSKKTQEVCKDQGMDSLLPMSIFATASFPEDLFVEYFIQLLILLDFKPPFAVHSIYDFSLANAISTFMFLFEDRLSAKEHLEDSS